VFEFPDVKDRFCNIQVLDAWTNTTKLITDGGTYVFAKKGQTVTVPSGATLVEMPTTMGWCIVRILNKGEGDYENVKKIQDAMKAYPLSAYGNAGYVAPNIGPCVEHLDIAESVFNIRKFEHDWFLIHIHP